MTTLLPFPRLRDGVSALAEAAEPDQLVLADAYGRVAKDLRVSLTDRCNLRCTYCMPPEGLEWLPADEALTDDEGGRLGGGAGAGGAPGGGSAGGGPRVRRGLVDIVRRVAEMVPRPRISLTTNGIGLART